MDTRITAGPEKASLQLIRQFRLEWLLFGVAMLVLGSYIGRILYVDYERIDAEERDRLSAQASIVDQNLGRQLVGVDRTLASIRDDVPMLKAQIGGKLLVNSRLKAMCDAMPGVRSIVLLDADGTVTNSNREELVGGNYRQQALFELVRQDREPTRLYVAPPFKTPLGVYAISVGKVILDDRGMITGMIWAVLDPGYFETVLNSVRYAPDVISSLIHGQGKVVFSVPDPQSLTGIDLAKPGTFFDEHIKSGKEVSLFSGDLHTSGEMRLLILRTIRPPAVRMHSPLVVAVSRDLSALFAPWRKEVYEQGGLFALIMLSAALGLYLQQRRKHAFERTAAVLEDERERAEEALARESYRNREFLRNASDGVHVLDADGNVLEVSDSFCEMLGYSREELLGANVSLWDAKWSPLELKKKIAEQIAAEHHLVLETRHRRRNGSMLDVEVTGHGLELDGKPVLFIAARDITERLRTQGELRTLSRAVEQSTASIVITDRAGTIEYVNARFEQVTGYARAEAVGTNPRILKSGMTPAETYRDLWKAISAGGEWRGELCNRRKNGELFWEYAAISGLKDENGQVGHYVAVKEDITARKRADAVLNEAQERFSAVFHASPIGISVSKVAQGTVVDINDAALRLYGYARDEMIGRTAGELGLYVDPEEREELVARLRQRGQVERVELRFRNKSGATGKLELTGRAIELQGEQCLVAMLVDVTERKRLEEVHLRAQKLESLGTLTGGIAHDFNNILAAIRGNVDLAAEDVGPDHIAAESFEEIRKACVRGTELVRRIMTFGRPRVPQQEAVDLGAVVDEVLKLLRPTLPASISLRREFAGEVAHVLADAGQIHDAIVNLTTNAAYAIGRSAGSIDYRLEQVELTQELARNVPGIEQGPYVRLTVTDTGCGMDAASLARIFDAFYTTKPVGEGTGLGLSMVHGSMRSHGGAVTAESTPGEGSSFALYFPVAKEKAQKEEQGAGAQILRRAGQRVMYVDDEEALVFLASRWLSRLGHRISTFTDPREALAAFRSHPQDYDVVVTDLSMPHMSGLELAREVLAIRPGMPVLMASGYMHAGDEDSARAAGIREVVLKPVTMDELGQLLDRLFRETQARD